MNHYPCIAYSPFYYTQNYPHINVATISVHNDYSKPWEIKMLYQHRYGYWAGSVIATLEKDEIRSFDIPEDTTAISIQTAHPDGRWCIFAIKPIKSRQAVSLKKIWKKRRACL